MVIAINGCYSLSICFTYLYFHQQITGNLNNASTSLGNTLNCLLLYHFIAFTWSNTFADFLFVLCEYFRIYILENWIVGDLYHCGINSCLNDLIFFKELVIQAAGASLFCYKRLYWMVTSDFQHII